VPGERNLSGKLKFAPHIGIPVPSIVIKLVNFFAMASFPSFPSAALLLVALMLSACNYQQIQIDQATKALDNAETNYTRYTDDDWLKLETSIEALDQDLTINKKSYSEQQIAQVRKLQGRYAALLLRKGYEDTKGMIRDFGKQVEGFIDGIKKDTTIKKLVE